MLNFQTTEKIPVPGSGRGDLEKRRPEINESADSEEEIKKAEQYADLSARNLDLSAGVKRQLEILNAVRLADKNQLTDFNVLAKLEKEMNELQSFKKKTEEEMSKMIERVEFLRKKK